MTESPAPGSSRADKMAQLAALRAGFDAKRAELRVLTAQTREMAEKAAREFRPFTAADRDRLAEAARSGEAGPEMRELQRRIDRGEFTWDQVLTGQAPEDAMEVWHRQIAPIRDIAAATPSGEVDDEAVATYIAGLNERGRGFTVPAGP